MIEPEHLDESYAGKRVRVGFADGEITEALILSIALSNKYDKTPESWGIVYDTISSNRPRTTPNGAANWSRLSEIETLEIWETGHNATIHKTHRHGDAARSRQR